jgi:hypothetical protein
MVGGLPRLFGSPKTVPRTLRGVAGALLSRENVASLQDSPIQRLNEPGPTISDIDHLPNRGVKQRLKRLFTGLDEKLTSRYRVEGLTSRNQAT